MNHEVQLTIYRGSHQVPAPPLDLTVSVSPRSTLLDALVIARDRYGARVAFDYACETNNSCKLCYVRVDGRPVYACTFLLEKGAHYRVDPIDRERPHQDLFLRREGVW